MSTCVIYKIVNKINSKVYIGQTAQGLDKRSKEHLYRYHRGERDHRIYSAFRKYGIENFIFEPVFTVFNKKDLDHFEKVFIFEYGSYTDGYNCNLGGDSMSEETKNKIRSKMLGRKITWYDKILTSRRKNSLDRTIKEHELLTSSGEILKIRNLANFCKKNCIDISNLYSQSKKDRFSKGYKLLKGSTTSP